MQMRPQSFVLVFACGVLWLGANRANAEEYAVPPKAGAGTSSEAREASEASEQAAPGDAALRGLLRSQRVSVDPQVTQLEALWAELSERPLAKTAGKPGLERARLELSRLRQLIDKRADAQ